MIDERELYNYFLLVKGSDRQMARISLLISIMLISIKAIAWDGYDYDSGSDVEIEQGNLVRPGEEIEYYDYGSGEYRYGDVESINSYGSIVEVEVYDQETDEYRTFEMED